MPEHIRRRTARRQRVKEIRRALRSGALRLDRDPSEAPALIVVSPAFAQPAAIRAEELKAMPAGLREALEERADRDRIVTLPIDGALWLMSYMSQATEAGKGGAR